MEFNILENCGHLGYATQEPQKNKKEGGSLLPPEAYEKAEQLNNLTENEANELQNLEDADNQMLLPMDLRERMMELRKKSKK